MGGVVQEWLENCSWKEQTVVLCALRGTDSGGSPVIKSMTRWIRRTSLNNAAPRKTFMRDEGFPGVKDMAEETPIAFDMLPVHFLGHLMHALEVIGYKHPDILTATSARLAYHGLCEYLHLNPESEEQMSDRLRDEL